MDISKVKKIELHCHLDGSLLPQTAYRILQEQGIATTYEKLLPKLSVPVNCESLDDYLRCFDLPVSMMQTQANLFQIAYELAQAASEENIKYIEVRFAPILHVQQGLSIKDVIEAVLAGFNRAREDFDIEYGVIVCTMRHLPEEVNIKMLNEAREFLGCGVVACDLAGGEANNPTSNYANVFEAAKKLGYPFTIHAGEQGSVKNVVDAIEFGASRIGHGLAVAYDEDAIKLVCKKNVLLELCPTSNLQTKAVASINEYPLKYFLKNGVKCCINTDNRTVSNVSLSSEYALMQDRFNLQKMDFDVMYRNAVMCSFASDDVKHKLLKM